ncbi:unnamed protein product [Urochloa humidicola]
MAWELVVPLLENLVRDASRDDSLLAGTLVCDDSPRSPPETVTAEIITDVDMGAFRTQIESQLLPGR